MPSETSNKARNALRNNDDNKQIEIQVNDAMEEVRDYKSQLHDSKACMGDFPPIALNAQKSADELHDSSLTLIKTNLASVSSCPPRVLSARFHNQSQIHPFEGG
ncbi:hypothetical protein RHGRI_031149 [Rhododendron griersonianum]|uniref:Uncharacterized protein n=1 Tax=Rhododendron griersonianum TaxID=479676 RepID=A0AAV6I9D3_9ERIC|nr:hypothetical protein RHGRI_031149 [Rhododendron griersonianum]